MVTRPRPGERQVLGTGTLHLTRGLVGDGWLERGSRHTADGTADPDKQLNVMSIRAAELVAGSCSRVPWFGDQLSLDLDIGVANLPAGSLLALGPDAAIPVTASPHNGCAKFGLDAMRFVNCPTGKELRLRGLCGRVVVPGVIRPGDKVTVTRPG